MIDRVINFLEKLQKEKLYNINDLYIGNLGKVEVTWTNGASIHGEFDHKKFVIMTQATKKEKHNYLKKYGSYMGCLTYTSAPNFICDNMSLDCYKVLSNNKIVPESSVKTVVCSNTYSGVYEIVSNVMPMSKINQGNKTCKINLPDRISLGEILDFEKQINNEYQMSM